MKNKPTYLQKLKDRRWQKKRLKVLERDGFKCQLWLAHKGTIVVHHKYYKRGKNPWDYPMEALISLCESCHEFVTPKKIKKVKEIIEQKEVKILTPLEIHEEELIRLKSRKAFFDKYKDDPCDCEPFHSCEKCSN